MYQFLQRQRNVDDGDEWNHFYDSYARLAYGFCLQRGCSHDTARDIFQYSVISVLKLLPSFELDVKKGQLQSVLLTIANLA